MENASSHSESTMSVAAEPAMILNVYNDASTMTSITTSCFNQHEYADVVR